MKEASSSPAHGWTALREEVERRVREARREKDACEKATVWRQYWVEHGKMAALDDLANWIAVTKEVPPIAKLCEPQGGEEPGC